MTMSSDTDETRPDDLTLPANLRRRDDGGRRHLWRGKSRLRATRSEPTRMLEPGSSGGERLPLAEAESEGPETRGLTIRTQVFLSGALLVGFTLGLAVTVATWRSNQVAERSIWEALATVPDIYGNYRSTLESQLEDKLALHRGRGQAPRPCSPRPMLPPAGSGRRTTPATTAPRPSFSSTARWRRHRSKRQARVGEGAGACPSGTSVLGGKGARLPPSRRWLPSRRKTCSPWWPRCRSSPARVTTPCSTECSRPAFPSTPPRPRRCGA